MSHKSNQEPLFPHRVQETAFFQSLPAYIQENIMQSGIEITSEDHLREVARHYRGGLPGKPSA